MRTVVRIALTAGVAIAVLNFAVFSMAAAYYGGVPSTPLFNAAPAAGPYFLDERGHLTDVSRQVFTALQWQCRSVIFAGILGVICGWTLKRKRQDSN